MFHCRSGTGAGSLYPARPRATSRRMDSGRLGLSGCTSAHSSAARIVSKGKRTTALGGLESVGLRRDIVLDGLEQGLKELRKAEPKRH